MKWQMMSAMFTQAGGRGERRMETQKMDVKNLLYSRRHYGQNLNMIFVLTHISCTLLNAGLCTAQLSSLKVPFRTHIFDIDKLQ